MTAAGPRPGPPGPRCVLLFASIHDVLRAERTLRERGLWCDLVPVPRALSAECGMAVELSAADRPRAAGLGWTAAWRESDDGGYTPA